MPEQVNPLMVGASQFRMEVLSLVDRYCAESDLSAYQLLGALKVVETDILTRLDQHNNPESFSFICEDDDSDADYETTAMSECEVDNHEHDDDLKLFWAVMDDMRLSPKVPEIQED